MSHKDASFRSNGRAEVGAYLAQTPSEPVELNASAELWLQHEKMLDLFGNARVIEAQQRSEPYPASLSINLDDVEASFNRIGNQTEVSGIPNILPSHGDIVKFRPAAPKPLERVA